MTLRFVLGLWVMFFIGVFTHAWVRADSAVKSPLNGVKSYHDYIQHNASAFAFRLFLAMMIFIGWQTDNNFIKDALEYIPFAKDWFANVRLEIPLNLPTAGLFGAGSDIVLDYIAKKAGMSSEIPPVGGTTISDKETKTETTEAGTTETVTQKDTVVTPQKVEGK